MSNNQPGSKHAEYYAIPAYQRLARLSDEQVAAELSIAVRTYREKINGGRDFTSVEGKKLSALFGVSQDELFKTA